MSDPNPVPVGTMPDGRPILEARLEGEGLSVAILSLGAVLRRLDFHGRPMVLGRDDPHDYIEKTPQFGAVVGRFANRIAGGRFTLDGTAYDLDRNEAGRTHLHGGLRGFSRRLWTFAEVGPRSLTLAYHAADGEEGYPGALDVTCTYAITGPGTLRATLTARTDKPTIVNLTNHSYFNLTLPPAGVPAPPIDDHVIAIPADIICPSTKRRSRPARSRRSPARASTCAGRRGSALRPSTTPSCSGGRPSPSRGRSPG